jgi:cold shock CspA family protein
MIEGVVESFDEQHGDGWFVTDAGERLYFHCVTIKDGSRTIPAGVRAVGRRSVGRLGRDEVFDVSAL